MIATLMSQGVSNIVSGELYPGGVHNADREMLGIIGEKKDQLLQLIQKIVVGQSFCSIECVECHGSKPRTSSSSPP